MNYFPGIFFKKVFNDVLILFSFAVWNTMMGTSLLSMPWAIEQAGLVAGLSLILVMAAICFYTAFCILRVYGIYGNPCSMLSLLDCCVFFNLIFNFKAKKKDWTIFQICATFYSVVSVRWCLFFFQRFPYLELALSIGF